MRASAGWSLEKRGSQFARHSSVVKLCAEETCIQSGLVQSVSPQSTNGQSVSAQSTPAHSVSLHASLIRFIAFRLS